MKGYMSAVVAIAVLVLVEIFLFTSSETANVKYISGKTITLENHIRELRALKHEQEQDIGRLQKDAVRFKRQVPASILYGFRDHEKLFAKFLDYLQSPAFAGIDKTFSFADKTKFIKTPVLLHQVSLNFIFHFSDLAEAKVFFNKIMRQVKKYPLTINSLKITREKGLKGKRLVANLQVLFLVPARLRAKILALTMGGKV